MLFAFRRFPRAAENLDEFVANDLFDVRSCGFKIFSGVKLVGVFFHELSDGARHSEAEVGVDIDLADRKLSRFAELFFGDADCVGHLAAVFVDHRYVFLRN